MLAIPVLLSIVLGFSGDFPLSTSSFGRDVADSQIEESDDSRGTEEFQQNGKDNLVTPREIVQSTGKTSKRLLLQKAIESNDYDAFLVATAGTSFGEVMTKDAFGVLVQEYTLRKNGYYTYVFPDLGEDEGDLEA